MKLTIKGKRYTVKQQVIDVLGGLGLLIGFILAVSWLQNLSIAWGVATW